MSEGGARTLRGYRSIGDITFDLDGELSTDIGWVVFEVSDKQPECCSGVIGTFNNGITLRLMRFAQTQSRCRVLGSFDDGRQTATRVLDDVVFTTIFVLDHSGFIGFRASPVT